nr:WD repeat-containing protein 55 isoform X1 [Ipomoea trifida]
MAAVEIDLEKLPFDLDFHPSDHLVATGLITGDLLLHRYTADSQPKRLFAAHAHTESCRAVRFINDGRTILTGSPDCSILATDVETGSEVARVENSHGAAVNRIVNLTESTVASGDDEGCVKVDAHCVSIPRARNRVQGDLWTREIHLLSFERLETTAVVHRLGLAIVNHQHKQVSAIVRWSPPFVAVEAEPTGSSPLILTPGKATLRGLAAGRGRASRTRHGGRRPGGRDWAATGRTRERGRRRSRLALSRCMGCGLVRLVRLVRILVRLVCRGLVRLVRITCEGNGKKRRVSGVRVRKPALLARGRSGNIHRYIQVGRMHIFHVDSQPLVKACSVQIDLLVLADRCGEAESFLKLVGVLFHRAAILTDVGEHAKGVSPEARTEAKVAPLLETRWLDLPTPGEGAMFAPHRQADGSSRPSKRGNSNRVNFGAVAAGTSDDTAACASSAGGRLPCWLPESSVAGPFAASSCRSICRISPCSVCIAVTAA